MSRLVVPPKLVLYERAMEGTRANVARTDDYQSRLAKYIPAEATASYLALENLIQASTSKTAIVAHIASAAPAAGFNPWSGILSWSGLAFAACFLFAPAYIWLLGRRTNNAAWKPQAFIAAAAFLVWAYAIKGNIFQSFGDHNPTLAGAMLILFSMGIALYEPKEV